MSTHNVHTSFRLVSRSTIEERMMQTSRKKMVLEHVVVRKLGSSSGVGAERGGGGSGGGLKQSELDDILRCDWLGNYVRFT